ncbi:tyrosine-type recombinase/integrase [Fusobacterium ulcerans]|uniref:tyrosine-type recombinase/integrase n=1 Tax=Fusobacterium ulcerans TaxID=861 RepID=UPI0026EBBE57|nr:tyrosine-type recombinase/integrase [Fusobacterium ulcerans]
MKNENGSGTVYKLGGKRRKPWIARITTGYSLDGKQLRKTIGTYSTKREGQEALFSYLKNPALFSKKTFEEVKELWLEYYKKKNNKKSTIETLDHRADALKPLFNKEIANIKLIDMQEVFDNINLSWNSKNAFKSTLNMIFDFALKNDLITSNRVRFIELGKKENVIERKIFTKEEIEILWNNTDKRYVCFILILIYTGMRVGEFINLKVSDIDIENKILQITESKTENGKRVIPINSKIFPLITKNINIYQKYFIEKKNMPLTYRIFSGGFMKVLKEIGISKHTIHDTRHTFATLLNNSNANSTSIIKLIGHSDFKTTESIYTHKDAEELRKAIESI